MICQTIPSIDIGKSKKSKDEKLLYEYALLINGKTNLRLDLYNFGCLAAYSFCTSWRSRQ